MKKCLVCQKELSGDYRKKFCNKSCAAILNNKIFPKRKSNIKLPSKGLNCDKSCNLKKRKYCVVCIKIIRSKEKSLNSESSLQYQTKGTLYARTKN